MSNAPPLKQPEVRQIPTGTAPTRNTIQTHTSRLTV